MTLAASTPASSFAGGTDAIGTFPKIELLCLDEEERACYDIPASSKKQKAFAALSSICTLEVMTRRIPYTTIRIKGETLA